MCYRNCFGYVPKGPFPHGYFRTPDLDKLLSFILLPAGRSAESGRLCWNTEIWISKMSPIALTRKNLYKQGVPWMVRQKDEGKDFIQIRSPEVSVRKWALSNVAKAIAVAHPPDQRQLPEVWEALHKLKLTWRLRTFVGHALWKKTACVCTIARKGDRRNLKEFVHHLLSCFLEPSLHICFQCDHDGQVWRGYFSVHLDILMSIACGNPMSRLHLHQL